MLWLLVRDDSTGKNNATAFGSPGIVDGKMGKARIFDRSEKQYIRKEHASNIDFKTNSFSIAFWMKAKTPEGWTVIMSKANEWGDDNDRYGWLFGNSDSPTGTNLEFAINSGGSGSKMNKSVQATDVFDDQLHHVVGVRNGEALSLYVDGSLKDSIDGVSQTVSVSEPLVIGACNDWYFYSGVVDEVVVWGRGLDGDEVAAYYGGEEIPFSESGLYYASSEGEEIEISGGVVKESNDECDGGNEGVLRYNKEYKIMEYCNGSEWRATFSPVPDGKTVFSAGESCKAILDDGYSRGDGVYWIDPDGYGGDEGFDVYCDMTTDGGWQHGLLLNQEDKLNLLKKHYINQK